MLNKPYNLFADLCGEIMQNTLIRKTMPLMLVAVVLITSACRKEPLTSPAVPGKSPVVTAPVMHEAKFIVETDFPYYYIEYKTAQSPDMKTVNNNNKKVWEYRFQTKNGDTLELNVNTLVSNLGGSYIRSTIWIDGVVVDEKTLDLDCEAGECKPIKEMRLESDKFVARPDN